MVEVVEVDLVEAVEVAAEAQKRMRTFRNLFSENLQMELRMQVLELLVDEAFAKNKSIKCLFLGENL